MTPLSPTALEAAENALYSILDDDDWTGDRPKTIATAAITAYLAQAEQEGWVLVPVEPTEAMILAGARKARLNDRKMQDAPGYESECHDIYAAMLAAAQNGGE